MHEGETPFRKLAIGELKRSFHDLILSTATFSIFERSIIEATFELQWIGNFITLDEDWKWDRTTRAAYNYLERGFQQRPKEISKAFAYSIQNVARALNKSWAARLIIKSTKDNDDEKTEKLLSCYKRMYEGMAATVLSSIAYSFKYRNKLKDSNFPYQVGMDGRIDLGAINKLERLHINPLNILKRGLNSHVRNAYSHEHFHILDNGEVELWDVHPQKRKITWGPVRWTSLNIEILIDELFQTSLAIVIALGIFSANYRNLIRKRGWVDFEYINPPMKLDEIKSHSEKIARRLGFRLREIEKNKEKLKVKLVTIQRGIDQDSDIFAGGEGAVPRRWIIKIKYVQNLVLEQVMGFFQYIHNISADLVEITADVFDQDGKEIGSASVLTQKIESFVGPIKGNLENDKKLLESESLGDQKMFVKLELPPVEL